MAWHHAQTHHGLPSHGVNLIHVDHHSDLGLPKLRTPIVEAFQSSQQLIDFTYRELDIGSFILPAVYVGWFDRIQWVRHDPVLSMEAVGWMVASHDCKGLEFFAVKADSSRGADPPADARTWLYRILTANGVLEIDEAMIVLDICLDYFSCNHVPEHMAKIEVTAAAFDEFNDNPYHFLRIFPGSKVTAEIIEDKYCLVFNAYAYESAGASKETEETILSKIDVLMTLLRKHDFTPQAITVSRSRHSGYTPERHWRYIEYQLLEALEQWRPLALVPSKDYRHGDPSEAHP
ncbi:MAG: UPF0489 family protein [Gammaproteobacteria bacterium]|nr:UPF0489 family protein [Gammaproteobacteria bacterium]